ncbi:MAG: holo-ACP synthase [Deferribacterales bacterium]
MLGCDIAEVGRIEAVYNRLGNRFLDRILTLREQELFKAKGAKMQFLAGRFAAKESISKSFKTGIGGDHSFTDIEILNDDKGAPLVYIKGILRSDIEISISHDRHYAMAVSLLKR